MVAETLVRETGVVLPLAILVALLTVLVTFKDYLDIPSTEATSSTSVTTSLPGPVTVPRSLTREAKTSLVPSPAGRTPLSFSFGPLGDSDF